MLDGEISQLLNSDNKDEEFLWNGNDLKKRVYFYFMLLQLNNVESYCE